MNFNWQNRFGKTRFLAGLCFWLPFLVYLRNLYPTISAGDSGELVTAAYYLGVPHPPGYPLYCLFGRLFISLIPFGSAAFRVNVMSAFFGALASLVLFFLLRKIVKDEVIAGVTVLLFAFSRTFWGEALEGEVYTIGMFFIISLLWLVFKWEETGEKKYLWLTAVFSGLSFAAHQTALMILPVLFLWIYLLRPAKIKLKEMIKMFFLMLVGLTVHLYVLIRALANPSLNWGMPKTLYLFLGHVLRWQYEGVTPGKHSLIIYFKQIFNYFYILSDQWPLVFFTLVGLGLVCYFQKNIFRSIFFLVCFVMSSFVLIYFTNYEINPLQVETQRVFYLISYIFVIIWLGLGLEYLIFRITELFSIRRSIIILFFVLLVYSLIVSNGDDNRHHQDYIAYDYGKNVFRSCQKNGILWVTGDVQVFTVAYLKKVEKLRPDLTIYDQRRIVFGDQYGLYIWPAINLLKPPIDFISSKIEMETYKLGRPVYYGWYKPVQEMPDYRLCPAGLIFQVQPKDRYLRPPYNYYKIYEKRGIWNENIPKKFLAQEIKIHYERHLIEYILVELGGQHLAKKEYDLAKKTFLQAVQAAPDYLPAHEGVLKAVRALGDKKLEKQVIIGIREIKKRLAKLKPVLE